jgi:nucleoside-diphosphate-sugar epimerase
MRVLVTGCAGFIGSQVTRLLVEEGHTVYGVIQPGESCERIGDLLPQVQLLSLDLADRAGTRSAIRGLPLECALHLAWYAAPGEYWTAPENLECVSMSLSLASVLAETGCRRLVGAGSCAEYDWDYGFLSEEITPVRPRTLYGACKNATRQILQAYCEQVSMSFAWTRFFYLYGPGEAKERLVPSVTLALLKGRAAKCTSGEQIRDFLHVKDVASAVWAVAKSTVTGSVNIGSGQPVRVRTVVETVLRVLGGHGKVEFGALRADSQEAALLVADVRKLKQHTSWTPSFELDEGLRQTVAWWRDREETSS